MKPASAPSLLAISWPFLLVVAALTMLALFSLDTLSAARAFASGESLWSKAQKQAVHCLRQQVQHVPGFDRACFERAMAVPMGILTARQALTQQPPDVGTARQGLQRAGSVVGDVDGMLRLLHVFGDTAVVADALAVWAEADHRVAELQQQGLLLIDDVSAGRDTAARLRLSRVATIDDQLTILGRRFAERVSVAARAASTVLTAASLCAALLLAALGLWMSRRLLGRVERATAELQASERRVQLALAASDHGIFDLDLARAKLHVSPHVLTGLGLEGGSPVLDLAQWLARVHEDDRGHVDRLLGSECPPGTRHDFEFRLRGGDGRWRWLRACGSAIHDGGRMVRVAGALSDVTERHLAEDRLAALELRARDTLASIGDAVLTTDASGGVEYLNPVAERLLGLSLSQVRGRQVDDVCRFLDGLAQPVHPHPASAMLTRLPVTPLPDSALLQRMDGTTVAIDATLAMIGGVQGDSPPGVVLVLRDVSRERADAARLAYQAAHDEVTGLLNRRAFDARLAQAVDGAHTHGESHALLMLDLDQFKIVNDTCGHAAGDELLRQVASQLQRHLRQADVLGRLGGDEFGVLLMHCAPAPAARLAETLRQALADFRYACGERPFPISASIGLVHLDAAVIDGAGALSAADSACHAAKEAGRNRVHACHVSDLELAARQDMMGWVARLQEALDEGRLCLDAQPIRATDPTLHATPHVELLLRMVERDGRVVPPMAFIPAAERYNLMPTLDRWVVRTAFAQIGRLGGNGQYAINLSGASVGDERFLAMVQVEQQRHGVDPARICFEVTETAAISHLDSAVRFMKTLRGMGFRFALDDFGAGMSSFGYLKHLPVDYLKIDGAFVKDMLSDPIDAAMVEAIHRIGQVMGMRTIAEFVDNDRVRARLAAIGVDFVQGYGIGRPEPFIRPTYGMPAMPAMPAQAAVALAI